ncbi:Coiled-coil domain-containing protein 50 [Bagarius yarrelli]|uniref:Coiled-coil domain-containing protein 50 n=1 Tax=Bagarius yarrelli TaxID=175774 RepID=A0A556VCB8_BAGYA|nr:Coiled-coil domain-containing protein 50 [Bagarius yarrelli]
MEDFSIDHKKLPGVKEVCREFAVLEDHCLAHNLQEQEIENHLASNIHKSRLVQQDLRVAKRLQAEEDQRAKAQSQKQHQDIERIDNEIAQEIQEQLVRQAEKQKQQEAKDEAIARKLQEREMKEERRRQKQLEAKHEEQYYDEKGDYRPPSNTCVEYLDSDMTAYGRERYSKISQGQSPDLRTQKSAPNRRTDSPSHQNKYQEFYPDEGDPSGVSALYKSEPNRGKNEGKARKQEPEHHLSDVRPKYPEEYMPIQNRSAETEARYQGLTSTMKERAYRDDPYARDRTRRKERDQDRDRERKKKGDKTQYRDKSLDKLNRDSNKERLRQKEIDYGKNGYRYRSRDRKDNRERVRDGERPGSRDRSRGHEIEGPSSSKRCSEESEENADYSNRQRLPSSDEVFEELSSRNHSKGHSSRYRGISQQEEYGVREAMEGLSQIDLQALEFKDMEVARRLQEEELMASKLDKRAAQVAQDEEIARRIMEEEEREYKKSREKERHQRRAEGDSRPTEEEMGRPRTREEFDYQKPRNPKPSRPPPPVHNYVNVDSSYAYSDNYTPRPASRHEAAYKAKNDNELVYEAEISHAQTEKKT